jgi:hypothetical protein
LLAEWAYPRLYRTNDERLAALPGWVAYFNDERTHIALGGITPTAALVNDLPRESQLAGLRRGVQQHRSGHTLELHGSDCTERHWRPGRCVDHRLADDHLAGLRVVGDPPSWAAAASPRSCVRLV